MTTQPELFTIDRGGSGALSTMARPRGGEALADDLAALSAVGVSVVVSLLTDEENDALALADEARLARQAGLDLVRLPTPDFGVPDATEARAVASLVRDRLDSGAHVVIHCRGGIGRSSTFAAVVLALEGQTVEDAWAQISAARGMPVPETDAQRDFVEGLARGGGEG